MKNGFNLRHEIELVLYFIIYAESVPMGGVRYIWSVLKDGSWLMSSALEL